MCNGNGWFNNSSFCECYMKKKLYFFLYLVGIIIFILAMNEIVGLTGRQAFAIMLFLTLLPFIVKLLFHFSIYKLIRYFLILAVCFVFIFRQLGSEQSVSIPQSLIEFADKYPEAFDFVNEYPYESKKKHNTDISNQLLKDTVPLFLQWDKRWGYEYYGNEFLAITGCGPTCLSMILCGLTNNSKYTPLYIANYAEQNGYYIQNEGTSWLLMTEGAENFGLNVECKEITKEYLLAELNMGHPIICSMWPGDFTYTGHFIVLTGIDNENNIILNDPNSYLKSEKHWDIDVLFPQIRMLWAYSLN